MARRGPGRPAGQPAKTEDEITAAGAAVFRELGYTKARMDDVAARLGITKSSLYHYVSTKQELLYRILLPPYREAVSHLTEVAQLDSPAAERLELIIERHIRNTVDYYPAISIYLAASQDTPVPEEMRALDRTYLAGLRQVVTDGMQDGSLQVLDPAVTVQAILGVCNWFAVTFDPDSGWDTDQVVAGFTAICLHGLVSNQTQGA